MTLCVSKTVFLWESAMKNLLRIGTFCLLASGLLAAQTGSTTTTTTTTTQNKPGKKTVKRKTTTTTTAAAPRVDTEIKELREAVNAQQIQMRELRDQLAKRDQDFQQAQQRLQQLESASQATQTKADTAATTAATANETASAVQSQVADIKSNLTNEALTIQDDQKKFKEQIESPTAIHFRGITITPGGFIEAAGIYRTHNENASVNSATADTNTPFEGQGNAFLSEFRGDARQSRLSLLAEGKLANMKASAYYETDFLGAAPTSNENESNSFVMRMRQLWMQTKFDSGLTVSAGQMFSLMTTTRQGQELRSEFLPQTIDAQYNVGYNWARQWGVRATQDFHNGVWVSVGVENPSTIVSSLNPPATILGLNNSLNALSPSGLLVVNCCSNSLTGTLTGVPGGSVAISSTIPGIANGVSTNVAPDLTAKVVFEPGWGHYEVKLLGRFFRDRLVNGANKGANDVEASGGIGGGMILPLLYKSKKQKLDFIVQGLYGEGIGRYSSGQGPDVTIRPDSTLAPIRAVEYLTGLEYHPTPKWDWVAYFGEDYFMPSRYAAGGKGVGYGSIG